MKSNLIDLVSTDLIQGKKWFSAKAITIDDPERLQNQAIMGKSPSSRKFIEAIEKDNRNDSLENEVMIIIPLHEDEETCIDELYDSIHWIKENGKSTRFQDSSRSLKLTVLIAIVARDQTVVYYEIDQFHANDLSS